MLIDIVINDVNGYVIFLHACEEEKHRLAQKVANAFKQN